MLRPHASHLVFLAGFSFVSLAHADAPKYDWSGFYVGGNGGYATGHLLTTESSLTTDGTVFGVPGNYSPPRMFPDPDDDKPFDGGFGGFQLGFNRQAGPLVFGTEADFQFSRIFRTDTDPVTAPNPLVTTSADLKMFGTVRGRLGLALDRVNVYGTGGFAYGYARGDLTVTGNAGAGTPYSASGVQIQYGYTFGGGLEAAITDHWIVRGEYLYMNLGTGKYTFAFPAGTSTTATSKETITENLFRGAISYKF
ncbi:MAG TPA: outer membrane beta-barrel protein [Bauldia sp.]|nr:outer membrane beta-barrel protein [Bauldia sp.]